MNQRRKIEIRLKGPLVFPLAMVCALAAGASAAAQNTSKVPKTVGPFVAYCATSFKDCADEIADEQIAQSLAQEQGQTVCQVPRGVSDDSADHQIVSWLAQHSELATEPTSDGVNAAIKALWNCVAEIPNGQTNNGAPENTAAFLSYCAAGANSSICTKVISITLGRWVLAKPRAALGSTNKIASIRITKPRVHCRPVSAIFARCAIGIFNFYFSAVRLRAGRALISFRRWLALESRSKS